MRSALSWTENLDRTNVIKGGPPVLCEMPKCRRRGWLLMRLAGVPSGRWCREHRDELEQVYRSACGCERNRVEGAQDEQ